MEKDFFDGEKKKMKIIMIPKQKIKCTRWIFFQLKRWIKIGKWIRTNKKKIWAIKKKIWTREGWEGSIKKWEWAIKKKLEEEADEKRKIQNEFLNLKNEISFKNIPEENKGK